MSDATNDDIPDFARPRGTAPPDLSGEPALLLVESLIHALVAKSGLSLSEAMDVVQIAIDAQIAIGQGRGDDPERTVRSAAQLAAIASSLAIDDHHSSMPYSDSFGPDAGSSG